VFSKLSKKTLFKAAIFQDSPVYVQFYITARCNLTCEQCNIIYANSDVGECSISEIEKIADNFAKMGVAIVLLTGGEPFARKDLPKIIYAFESRNIHIRMQTNGFANEDQIAQVVESGGKDISISLDSLKSETQDKINGGFNKSWHKALKTISLFTKYLPKKNSFASLGCVFQPNNMNDVEQVIEFGTKIDWYTSLVPIHVTEQIRPRGFRTFDQTLKFKEDQFDLADKIIENIREMRNRGYLLYDSDQYLDDIKLFIKNKNTNWRSKNNNICDSQNLYFAILPNGEFAPCGDHRLKNSYMTYDDNFPKIYKDKIWRNEVVSVTSKCEGCMYGSYPEITISMRFLAAKIQRMKTFFNNAKKESWPLSYEYLIDVAEDIKKTHRYN
jgi:MoaA/NifB/PqqE/SkfB family radical SAM enzyme